MEFLGEMFRLSVMVLGFAMFMTVLSFVADPVATIHEAKVILAQL
jgi:hypothetical protein